MLDFLSREPKRREEHMTGETIQIVESDGLIALHIAQILEKAGYRVIEPANSREMLLKTLEKSPKPDLIIIDLDLMGKINNIETARQIRLYYDIPILLLTAYWNKNMFEEAKSIPSCGYLDKPYQEKSLLAAIEKFLKR
jgi:CheY-like chemotaxis protein